MATRARPAHRKSCSRCRKRKIRCDAALPSCKPCLRAGSQCMSYDAQLNDTPRSLVTHLEEEVTALELELQMHEATTSAAGQTNASASLSERQMAIDAAIASAVAADAAELPNDCDALIQSTVRLTLQVQSSRLPLPFTDQQSRHGEGRPKTALSVQQIPRAAAELMLKNYTEIHLPQYPCVSEVYLNAAFDRCVNNEDAASPFDKFIVSIAMAISANTLMWKHEENAVAASAGFWAMARAQIEQPTLLEDAVQHLQYLLLMVHYGVTNPAAVDVWLCVGDAVGLCLQLGYHLELPSIGFANASEVDARRRLFWTTCSMEWALPSSLPDYTIQSGAAYGPEKKASAWHMLQYRQLEIEVLRALFFFHSEENHSRDNMTWEFEHWSEEIMHKLTDWHSKSLAFAAEQKITFRNVQYNYLRGRMHRPTPRVPNPSRASRKICLESAMALAVDYNQQQTGKRLFYPWHACHILFEAGIYLLDTAWSCAEWLVELDTCREVIECIRNYPLILQKLAKSWPAVDICARTLADLSEPVILRLETTIARGFGPPTSSILTENDSVSKRITKYLFPVADIGLDLLATENPLGDTDFRPLDAENAPIAIDEENYGFLQDDEMLTLLLEQDFLGLSGF